MTDARRLLTELVDDARDRGTPTALTEYERPRAFVVGVPYFERAEQAAHLAKLLQEREPALYGELVSSLPTIAVPLKMKATKKVQPRSK